MKVVLGWKRSEDGVCVCVCVGVCLSVWVCVGKCMCVFLGLEGGGGEGGCTFCPF